MFNNKSIAKYAELGSSPQDDFPVCLSKISNIEVKQQYQKIDTVTQSDYSLAVR